MNRPAHTPVPVRRGPHLAWIVVLRALLVAVPVLSIGILAWLPMLWTAIVSRRARDWWWFAAVAAMSVAGLMFAGATEKDDDWPTNLGISLLFVAAVVASAYAVTVDVRRRRNLHGGTRYGQPYPAGPLTPPPPYPSHPPVAHGRLDQVRAELDELSAYLRDGQSR
jgi:drug/metabolite transporter (DMT)-like permease